MSSGLFKMLHTNYLFTNRIFKIYMHEQDLALNNLHNKKAKQKHPTKLIFSHDSQLFYH